MVVPVCINNMTPFWTQNTVAITFSVECVSVSFCLGDNTPLIPFCSLAQWWTQVLYIMTLSLRKVASLLYSSLNFWEATTFSFMKPVSKLCCGQVTKLNCQHLAHLKTLTEFSNSDTFINFNENISLLNLILVHSSSWPATVGPFVKVSISCIAVNSTDTSPYCVKILWIFVLLLLSM